MRQYLTDLLLFLLVKVNPFKDRCLAGRLEELARNYKP
jgi:hypothetical protein